MGKILGSKGTKSSGSSGTTPGFTEQLEQSLTERQKSLGQYGKQQAIDDVQGVLRTQATDALQQVMPSIAQTQTQSGMYDTTSKELLRNDATARITAQLANTQLQAIKDYAGIEQGDINSFSNATKANTTVSGEQKSSGGGSGLLGLFADGGQVPKTGQSDPMDEVIGKIQAVFAPSATPAEASTTPVKDGIKSAMSTGNKADDALAAVDSFVDNFVENAAMSMMGFADGGKVPSKQPQQGGNMLTNLIKSLAPANLFDQTNRKREQDAGIADPTAPQAQGITINVNSGSGGQQQQPQQEYKPYGGFANGGQVPSGISPGMVQDHTQLLEAIRHHANGGTVRSGASDVKAGGTIRGPQTKSGEDNQVIAVGGGEGILAADVMEVPGVSEFVKYLNDNYHTPK